MGVNTNSSNNSDTKSIYNTFREDSIPIIVEKLNKLQASWIFDLTCDLKE